MKFINIFLLLLSSFTASAKPLEIIEYKYYFISPRAPQEIKLELSRHSPIRARGGSFNGHTDWYIDWNYQTRQHPSHCQILTLTTTVKVIYTLPALSEYVNHQQTIDVFNTFNDALTKHETNHGKNGLTAAREIDSAFSNMPAQQNCRHVSRMINDIGNGTVQKYIRIDDEYDRSTKNGMTEGAVIY